MSIEKIYHTFKEKLGISGYKSNFLKRRIFSCVFKRYGYKGIFYFLKNFMDIKYTTSEMANSSSMFIRLHLEPTINCNLNCKMCNRQNLDSKSGNMTFDAFKKIVDDIPNLVDVQLTGLGETLLNPDILNMLEYLKLKEIYFGLTTNGILLTDQISNKILEFDIGWISISIDGANRKTYKLIRNSDKFDDLIRNIKNLQRLKARLRKNVFTELAMVCMKENINELFDIVELANKLEFGAIKIKILEDWNPDGEYGMWKAPHKESYISKAEYLPKIYQTFKKAKSLGIKLEVTVEIKDSEYRRIFKNTENKCESPWYHIGVLYNGDVVPCCYVKTPQRNYVFGNILREDFVDIWNNSRYRSFRKEHLSGKPPDICNYCTRTIIKT